jgi:hypothetical protein
VGDAVWEPGAHGSDGHQGGDYQSIGVYYEDVSFGEWFATVSIPEVFAWVVDVCGAKILLHHQHLKVAFAADHELPHSVVWRLEYDYKNICDTVKDNVESGKNFRGFPIIWKEEDTEDDEYDPDDEEGDEDPDAIGGWWWPD